MIERTSTRGAERDGLRRGDRPTELTRVGIGYTLATGRLFCAVDEFHRFAEALMDRPIDTHEFGDEALWEAMREEFERQATAAHPSSLAGAVKPEAE